MQTVIKMLHLHFVLVVYIFIEGNFKLNFAASSVDGSLYITSTRSNDNPCPFNNKCSCIHDEYGRYEITCQDFTEFPKFSPYNITSYSYISISISGNFTYIPSKCINELFIPYSVLDLNIVGPGYGNNFYTNVFIDPEAFSFSYDPNFGLYLYGYSFTYIPTFESIPQESGIAFWYGLIPYISDFSFNKFAGNQLIVYESNVEFIEESAFRGLPPLDKFILGTNPSLNNISSAFKWLRAYSLYLDHNNISEVKDFSFCECSNFTCPNIIRYLNLLSNPISFISSNAFANLPDLIGLNLYDCKLSNVPSAALLLLPNLNYLGLDYNAITFVSVNSFSKLHNLTRLDISYNPILIIETGAFNGLTSMTELELYNLNMLVVDLLITYGMTSLQTLALSSSNLTTIQLSDYLKLPPSLRRVDLSNGNVINIAYEIQYWLHESHPTIDISNNVNYLCDDSIQWMAEFVCYTQQIEADGTLCAGTKQPLIAYLQLFQPACN